MKYTWKHATQISSDTTLETNRPLEVGTVLVDLFTGLNHQVLSISKAKGYERGSTLLPEDVLQTLPAGACDEKELETLRKKAGYTVTEDSAPLLDVVFDLG